jgi:hypothetical protein
VCTRFIAHCHLCVRLRDWRASTWCLTPAVPRCLNAVQARCRWCVPRCDVRWQLPHSSCCLHSLTVCLSPRLGCLGGVVCAGVAVPGLARLGHAVADEPHALVFAVAGWRECCRSISVGISVSCGGSGGSDTAAAHRELGASATVARSSAGRGCGWRRRQHGQHGTGTDASTGTGSAARFHGASRH